MTDPTTETTEPTTEAPETTDADLGDAGKRALATERAARVKAERALKVAQDAAAARDAAELSELERFKKENAELQQQQQTASLEALRMKVALEKGLPADLAARLQGDDYDELSADADTLAGLVVKPGSVRPDPSQGAKGGASVTDPAAAFAAHVQSQLSH